MGIKSIARFRCVSKLYASIHIRPRLLFALQRANDEVLIFSSPQPQPHQKQHEKSLVVAADFHMKISQDLCPVFRGLTSRLIYFCTETDEGEQPLIYNPITGEQASLPELSRYRKSYSFIGYGPIEKHFKVLFMAYPYCFEGGDHRIMTLGTGERSWRKITCILQHVPVSEGICIDGVLYYMGEENNCETSCQIVCFYVRTERVSTNRDGRIYVYTLPENEVFVCNVFVVGMTSTGEIVLSDRFTSKPLFYVFYFNPESNTLQTVQVRGVGGYHEAFEADCVVNAFVDYAVDSRFIT
ncbi:unnamed protein product [Microthlaspi erraticum]|uniref:F-box associated beta-propeller type 3 domain-containing protein n=1 Tax=Microthlaspi erraticum TaxID=1685480 RepID=A0A6D2HM46_9BRAS|nr:unnamed protein product [Microthlaspi erraticum]